jgi:hypothetical protein
MLGEIEETSLDDVCRNRSTSSTRQRAGSLTWFIKVLASLRSSIAQRVSGSALSEADDETNSVHPPPQNVPALKPFPYPEGLSHLVTLHQRSSSSQKPNKATPSYPLLSLSGRPLPLVYTLLAALLAPPHSYAVSVIDLDGRFDVTRLLEVDIPSSKEASDVGSIAVDPSSVSGTNTHLEPHDLAHLYVSRPANGSGRPEEEVRRAVERSSNAMLYGDHGSRAREWWGVIVVGEIAGGSGGNTADHAVNVVAGWKGWLRVGREEVGAFGPGTSVQEALRDRQIRQQAVDEKGWTAKSVWGGLLFGRPQS